MRVSHRSIDGDEKPITVFEFPKICFNKSNSGFQFSFVDFKFMFTCFNLSIAGIKSPIIGFKKANACTDLSTVGFDNSIVCFAASIAGFNLANTTHAHTVKVIFPTRNVMKDVIIYESKSSKASRKICTASAKKPEPPGGRC